MRGFVYFDKRRGAMSCLVRDLSEQGARIILSEAVTIPDNVNLHIPQREETLRARVQWRRGDEIGLVFPDAGRTAAPVPQEIELIKRVAQLESEILTLKQTIKKLKREYSGDETEAA